MYSAEYPLSSSEVITICQKKHLGRVTFAQALNSFHFERFKFQQIKELLKYSTLPKLFPIPICEECFGQLAFLSDVEKE